MAYANARNSGSIFIMMTRCEIWILPSTKRNARTCLSIYEFLASITSSSGFQYALWALSVKSLGQTSLFTCFIQTWGSTSEANYKIWSRRRAIVSQFFTKTNIYSCTWWSIQTINLPFSNYGLNNLDWRNYEKCFTLRCHKIYFSHWQADQ